MRNSMMMIIIIIMLMVVVTIRPTYLHSINSLVLIVGKQFAYCVVQPESLNILKLK